jgi:hypothetical protein
MVGVRVLGVLQRSLPVMTRWLAIGAWVCLAASAVQTLASPVSLSNVPAYDWYHGCGPTAAASIIGYYDLRGYDNLFTASGWDAVKLTVNVQDQISSPAHNAKYDPDPDDFSRPVPTKTSIADWFRTSVNLAYGWSYLDYALGANGAFQGYATYRGYNCETGCVDGGYSNGWNSLVTEINAGRPVMFLVDYTGDGDTDHFVPVFGYEDRGSAGLWYECYTTWTEDETPSWHPFLPMSSSYAWGVGYEVLVQFDALPVPEPSAIALLGTSAIALLAFKVAGLSPSAVRRVLHGSCSDSSCVSLGWPLVLPRRCTIRSTDLPHRI